MHRVLIAILTSFGVLFVIVTVTSLVSQWARTLAGLWNDPREEILIMLEGFFDVAYCEKNLKSVTVPGLSISGDPI